MKFRTCFGVLLLILLTSRAGADLAADIKAVLREKYLSRAQVGISIVRLGGSSGTVEALFRHESDIPLIPASNLKLATTAAALERLGPEFKFRTMLLLSGENLYLIGDGDPTFGDAELLKKSGWGVTTVFGMWAGELKKRGITSLQNVYVDDSVFDEVFVHPNWSPRYASARYSAGVAGVNLNANCVDFYLRAGARNQIVQYRTDPPTRYLGVRNTCVTGNRNAVVLGRVPGKNEVILSGEVDADSVEPISVTVHDPAMFAATVLSETLIGQGVSVAGAPSRDRTIGARFAREPSKWSVVAALETPIATVLGRANKDSVNVYAEALCKRLGHAATGEPGSWASGTAAVGEYLGSIGMSADQFNLDDGCGLSRRNSISAGAITTLLGHVFNSSGRQVFVDSLGVAGVDGTLERRFRGSDLRERVLAKSGYIDGVSSLSGYLRGKGGEWYAFSILMNDLPEKTNNTAKEMQERIVKAIDASAREKARS